MSRGHQFRRRCLAAVTGSSLVLTGLGAGVSAAQPQDQSESVAASDDEEPDSADAEREVEIAQGVLDDVAADGTADFMVHFEDRADLSAAAGIADWDERGWFVYESLTNVADRSQADAIAALDAEGAEYSAFWISNVIHVSSGDQELMDVLAADPEVEAILTVPAVQTPDPEPVPAEMVAEPIPFAAEWGVADINAPQVWDEFGVTGEGIVVGILDSGVQYDHPALVNQYRGNNGDGTFTHDYQWHDWGHGNPDHPADEDPQNSHGTHVTGTVLGDDGGENQIGVAPGAQWIASNGCCPDGTLIPLLAGGQWMLAPTDLDGENDDPGMRPHIVNNSWGAPVNQDDPTYDQVTDSWAAAGMMGVWALGNSGPGCETAGTPGNRPFNLAVGNYQEGHTIWTSSSRGANYDDDIKPDVAAPGTNVRSSQQGDTYGPLTGTSMASPHAAGAVALLWSGAPALVGDLDATWDLLTDTAIATEDLQCGGTAEHNNVFGHGRVDAHALLSQAPTGEAGVLNGVVLDASHGGPVADADVTITGDGDVERTLRTDADGGFSTSLPAGEYDLAVSAFGYADTTDQAGVEPGETATVEITLEPIEAVSITGTVTDGSGQGWALYARVAVEGTEVSAWTDPQTGEYSIDLPPGDYTVIAEAFIDGYTTGTQEVTITDGTVVDFALTVTIATCQAPGYGIALDEFLPMETFDAETVPEGWEVTDDAGSGSTWTFDNPGGRDNATGGEGNFAIVDAGDAGSGVLQDTSLISPTFEASEATMLTLEFKHDYFQFVQVSTASVEYTIDGGETWITALQMTDSDRGPVTVHVPLDEAVGAEAVQIRFHYFDDGWGYRWQVDDVTVINQDCLPAQGGLVVGHVRDLGTDEGLVGASVVNLTTGERASTASTDGDDSLDDGFYYLFSPSGSHDLEATAGGYESVSENVVTTDGDVVVQDFSLGSPSLEQSPESIETEVVLGDAGSVELTISNTGTGVAEIELGELSGGFELLRDGGVLTQAEVLAAPGAPAIRHEIDTSAAAFGQSTQAEGDLELLNPGPSDEPWMDLSPYPTPIMDNRTVNLDGIWYSIAGTDGATAALADAYSYDPAEMEWVEIAPLPEPRTAVNAAAVGGQIVVAGGWDTDPSPSTWIYDPVANEWSDAAPMPAPVSAGGVAVYEGQMVVVGGCTTGGCAPTSDLVQVYDPDADAWEELETPYPRQVAFPACAGLSDGVYCTGGYDGSSGTADTWHLADLDGDWTALEDAPHDSWATQHAGANNMLIVNGGVMAGAVSNQTMAYDAEAGEWIELPNSNQARYRGAGVCGFGRIGGSIGSFAADPHSEVLPGLDECGPSTTDVPWLDLDAAQVAIDPGESVTVTITTDSSGLPLPGTYTAAVRLTSNAPGSAPEVPVAMRVLPPAHWGKLTGHVQGDDCTGTVQELAGAVVDLKPAAHAGWALTTNSEGDYAHWFDTRVGPVDMVVVYPDFAPAVSTGVVVPRGEEVAQDFVLHHRDCEIEVPPIHPDVDRISGANRYETAATISSGFEPGVETVFLVSGQDFPDALAGAARAGALDAPILLTRQDRVPLATEVELRRLAPERVVLLGGANAISPVVEEYVAHLPEVATVDRLAGANRYHTAALVSQEYEQVERVYVATGADHADALGAATRAGMENVPVLLVQHGRVPAATATALERLDPEVIVVLGGEEAISEEVETALGAYGEVERIAGATRSETAALLFADYATVETVYISSGRAWPDAISGSALAARDGAPMVLVNPTDVPAATWEALTLFKPESIWVIGGDTVVTDDVLDVLAELE